MRWLKEVIFVSLTPDGAHIAWEIHIAILQEASSSDARNTLGQLQIP